VAFTIDNMAFKAYALTNEIDLNKIALEHGSSKKYTWEEPLGLQDKVYQRIVCRMDYCNISSCRSSFNGCGTCKIMESTWYGTR
jgi:hypothetical protein